MLVYIYASYRGIILSTPMILIMLTLTLLTLTMVLLVVVIVIVILELLMTIILSNHSRYSYVNFLLL